MISSLLPQVTPPTISRSCRSVDDVLAPLKRLAATSASLVLESTKQFLVNGEEYELPRFVFIGPQGGGSPIHIGVFAAIHGDEPEGTHATAAFIQMLEAEPGIAAGYQLSFYPICNPTGFEDNTRHSRSGRDLDREFWSNSAEPEVRVLENELFSRSFDGIISLHTHNEGDSFYGSTRGVTLTKHLIEPALRAAETFLPRDERKIIDGSPARNGVLRASKPGILSAPQKSKPRPFEITLEAPKSPPAYLKEYAVVVALRAILLEYQNLISYAQNI